MPQNCLVADLAQDQSSADQQIPSGIAHNFNRPISARRRADQNAGLGPVIPSEIFGGLTFAYIGI